MTIGRLVAVDAVDSSRSVKQRQHALTVTVGCQAPRPGRGLTAEYGYGFDETGTSTMSSLANSDRSSLSSTTCMVSQFLLH